MKKLLSRAIFVYIVIVSTFVTTFFSNATMANAQLGSKFFEREYPLATGAKLKKENYENGNLKRAINVIAVDMNTATLSADIALGNPFNRLSTLLELAHRETVIGSRYVVGTINASFFLMNGSGMPANLVVKNNEIMRLGNLSATPNDPIHYRYAFGISASGKPMIDSYQENLVFHYGDGSVKINNIDAVRHPNTVILFTPSLGYKVPMIDTNDSTEIVVTNASKDTSSLSFGDRVTGVVSSVTRNNRGTMPEIPKDGFVIAARGKENLEKLKNVKVGDKVSFTLSIDEKWMNSKAMIATGPLLVKGGKVSISMNENSSFASTRHPRSAVGITKDNKLLLVTVDGKQPGYSDGMTIRELANYMVQLGAETAINLDGGGSTAMAARISGHDLPYLVNRPSENRRISNAIQIISTEPPLQITAPALEIENFSSISNWRSGEVNAKASISLGRYEPPAPESNKLVALNYDFITNKKSGTSASYLIAKQPIMLEGKPKKIGMWVFGDGKENWLRGLISDRNGKLHYLNFTGENQLNWYGWKYVTATIPSDIPTPIYLDRVYIAQTKENKKSKGTILIDQLEAIYTNDYQNTNTPAKPTYVPTRFVDVPNNHWAAKEIASLVEQKVINGFPDGTFKPGASITREQVAVMIVRQLKLDTNNRKNPNFRDVQPSDYSYKEIATVAELGLLTGRRAGYFDPKAQLTRAEAAVILQRAYNLKSGENLSFKDVSKAKWDWAYDAILSLAANNISTGYPDKTFKPANPVTRAEFAAFLYRVNQK